MIAQLTILVFGVELDIVRTTPGLVEINAMRHSSLKYAYRRNLSFLDLTVVAQSTMLVFGVELEIASTTSELAEIIVR